MYILFYSYENQEGMTDSSSEIINDDIEELKQMIDDRRDCLEDF